MFHFILLDPFGHVVSTRLQREQLLYFINNDMVLKDFLLKKLRLTESGVNDSRFPAATRAAGNRPVLSVWKGGRADGKFIFLLPLVSLILRHPIRV